MTVIVGLEANSGEKGIVIGADRLSVNGNMRAIQSYLLKLLECEDPHTYDVLEFMEKYHMHEIKMHLDHKIEVSEKNDSVLAHTGSVNTAHDRVKKLLLSPEDFLQDDSLLTEMLFPFELPKDVRRSSLDAYRSSFNLCNRIRAANIPEIRRIFDLQAVQKYEIFGLVCFDRNYNADFSEYLFATLFDFKGKLTPVLFDVSSTGAVCVAEYSAKGCGQKEALAYMRKRLGTENLMGFGESKIKRPVTIEEAVDIVKEAVRYTDKRNQFCKGLDYAVITQEGTETHFSDKKRESEISLCGLINKRLKSAKKEVRLLERARKHYQD